MSGEEVRKVSHHDSQLVQNFIEQCLKLYMNKDEVAQTLWVEEKIEPGFTEQVWQMLEEENKEFFEAYHSILMLKQQIVLFNKLLEQQAMLMRNIHPAGAVPLPLSVQQNPSCCAGLHTFAPRSDSMCDAMQSSGAFRNGRLPMQDNILPFMDASIQPGMMNLSHSMPLTLNSRVDMLRGMNEMETKSESNSIKTELNCSMFGTEGNVLGSHPAVGEPPSSSFPYTVSNSMPLPESSLEADIGISPIPRNFSLSDLPDSFPPGLEIVENYSRSPLVGTGSSGFVDSLGNECQGENKRLDTMSEGLSYEEFVPSD